jgi:tetratricopeptide (TPR) repeat protein
VETFERAKALYPSWPQSYFGLAVANYTLRRPRAALAHVETFVTLVPDHVVGRCLAMACAAELAGTSFGVRKADFVKAGRAQWARLDRFRGFPLAMAADAALTAAEGADPAAAKVKFAALDRALAAGDQGGGQLSNAIVYEVAAMALVESDPATARRYAEAALAVRKGTERSAYVVARVAELDGKDAEAAAAYRALAARFPDSTNAASAQCALRLRKPELVTDAEAEAAALKLVNTPPDRGRALLDAGRVLAGLGKTPQAAAAFERATLLYDDADDAAGEAEAKAASARLAEDA